MRKLLNVVLTVIGLMFLSSGVAAAYDNSNSSQTIIDHAREEIEFIVTTVVQPIVDPKDLECLAKNIFYESGHESYEGKIAVGMVTINRSQDARFPQSICGVVKQRTSVSVPRKITTTRMVKTGFFGKLEKQVETETVWKEVVVCQFSWYCMRVPAPKSTDPKWLESRQVAEQLLSGDYETYHPQYGNLKFFHNTFVRPAWRGLRRIVKIGGHIFYASNE
jgi:spore germination cell wall hydrolase CwlJ-like protein